MIVFADSHVDLMSNIAMTGPQVAKRWDRELLRKWSKITQDNLRDFMQIKDSLDPETFPNYAENDAMLAEFVADKASLYAKRVADDAFAILLDQVLAYEQAVRDVADLELRIDGREAVDEVSEETDPETGEVTQVYLPAITSIEPMAATIEVEGETIDNPEYLTALADLEAAEAIIAAVSDDEEDPLRALIVLRNNQ